MIIQEIFQKYCISRNTGISEFPAVTGPSLEHERGHLARETTDSHLSRP